MAILTQLEPVTRILGAILFVFGFSGWASAEARAETQAQQGSQLVALHAASCCLQKNSWCRSKILPLNSKNRPLGARFVLPDIRIELRDFASHKSYLRLSPSRFVSIGIMAITGLSPPAFS